MWGYVLLGLWVAAVGWVAPAPTTTASPSGMDQLDMGFFMDMDADGALNKNMDASDVDRHNTIIKGLAAELNAAPNNKASSNANYDGNTKIEEQKYVDKDFQDDGGVGIIETVNKNDDGSIEVNGVMKEYGKADNEDMLGVLEEILGDGSTTGAPIE